MRIAISNIAWDVCEDEAVAKILKKFSIDAIDVAPSKYFLEPALAKDVDIKNVRQWWEYQGVEITGLQSLLFGTTGLNVFGNKNSQNVMMEHLRAICRIGAGLGATRLVFGSPKNRDRSGLSNLQALDHAVIFFRRLGDIAKDQGVMVCLEPNPVCYGSNFMTNTQETIDVVTAINHRSIRMQFDTGAISINEESPIDILADSANLVGHIHASEPDLLPLGDGSTDHQLMHEALKQHLADHVVSVEMLATKSESHLSSIQRALECAIEAYRPENRLTK